MKASSSSQNRNSVALYGGSFDPVHGAHLEVALAALDCCHLDTVVFIPAAQSPLKQNSLQASDTDRIKMLRLATAGEPRFQVDTCEIERGGTSYAVDTVKAYLARQPECQLHWIIGADQFELLPQWRSIEEIAALLTFIVLRRPGHSIGGSVLADLRFLEIDAPLMPHSSTEIRERLAAGRSTEGFLPPAVEAFISSHGLYTR